MGQWIASWTQDVYRDDPSSLRYLLTPVTAISFLITLLLTFTISPTISPLLASKYRSLGSRKRTFDTFWPSTLHALTVSSMALYLLGSGKMGTDSLTRIYSKEPLGFVIMQIALGYFLADLIVSLSDRELCDQKTAVVHHLVAATAVCFGLCNQGKYMYFVVLCFTTEVSTPFLNFWQILQFTDNTSNCLHAFASVGLGSSFFLCRIATIPWHWYVAVNTIAHPSAGVLVRGELTFMLVAFYVMFDVLNCYWFYQLMLGGLEMLRGRKKKS